MESMKKTYQFVTYFTNIGSKIATLSQHAINFVVDVALGQETYAILLIGAGTHALRHDSINRKEYKDMLRTLKKLGMENNIDVLKRRKKSGAKRRNIILSSLLTLTSVLGVQYMKKAYIEVKTV